MRCIYLLTRETLCFVKSLRERAGDCLNVHFPPQMYHWFVRPKWFTKKYIHDQLSRYFRFDQKMVLDFGSGTGANCCMFDSSCYLGIEPDSQRVRYARRLYPDHQFLQFDRNGIPLEDGSIDYLLIIAVLHHISTEEISSYMEEFRRILKENGKLIVIEPYLCAEHPLCNEFMKWYDSGSFIRHEDEYIRLFSDHGYHCRILKRFRKCLLYNELFFTADPCSSRKEVNVQ